MKTNNCPSCGGRIEFSPDDQALKCEKCFNVFPIKFNPPKAKRRIVEGIHIDNDKGFEKWRDSKRTFQCKNCGAKIVLNKFDMATRCSYCNTSSLVQTNNLPGLKPDAVIPFKISKTKANEQFKSKIKKKKFLPNDFKKNIPETQIGATYLSSFSFAINSFATYNGLRAVSRTVRTKNGTETVTELVPFSGTITHNFDNIVVECSDKIEQSQINEILPYSFEKSYEYNDDFITGYSVEYYNQTITDAKVVAEKQALNSLDSMIRMKHNRVHTLNIHPQYSNHAYTYALLPLYFINFQYKDKQYLNLMNGQTGKTAGKVPRSAVKITFFTLFIVFLVIGIPLLISLFV